MNYIKTFPYLFLLLFFSIKAMEEDENFSKKQKKESVEIFQPDTLFNTAARVVALEAVQQNEPAEYLCILPDAATEKVVKIPLDAAHRSMIYYARTAKQVQQILAYRSKFHAKKPQDIFKLSPEEFALQNNFFSALKGWKKQERKHLQQKLSKEESQATKMLENLAQTSGPHSSIQENSLVETVEKLKKEIRDLRDKSHNQNGETYEQFYCTDLRRNNIFYLPDDESCRSVLASYQESGEFLDKQDIFGNTPLRYCVTILHLNAAQALVERGAVCSVKDLCNALKLNFVSPEYIFL